jgi:hypothetical protein
MKLISVNPFRRKPTLVERARVAASPTPLKVSVLSTTLTIVGAVVRYLQSRTQKEEKS